MILNIFYIYLKTKLSPTQLDYYQKNPYEKNKVPLNSIFKNFALKYILVILLCF
jgi:NADH:ubiquinone oxidoreductase subunit 3 (subunit A)